MDLGAGVGGGRRRLGAGVGVRRLAAGTGLSILLYDSGKSVKFVPRALRFSVVTLLNVSLSGNCCYFNAEQNCTIENADVISFVRSRFYI